MLEMPPRRGSVWGVVPTLWRLVLGIIAVILVEGSTISTHISMRSTLLDLRVGGIPLYCIDKQMSKEASTLKLLVSLPNRDAPWS